MSYRIIPTPQFQKDVKHLQKKYRHIVSDLEKFNSDLNANPFHGEAIRDLEGEVFKTRLASSDMNFDDSKDITFLDRTFPFFCLTGMKKMYIFNI